MYIRNTIGKPDSKVNDTLIFLNWKIFILLSLFKYSNLLYPFFFAVDLFIDYVLNKGTYKKKNYVWDMQTFNFKSNLIKDLNDFIQIDDLYKILKLRNSEQETFRLKFNADCFNLADKILRRIDWYKYR